MVLKYEKPEPFRIVSIDPGSDTLGLAHFDYDFNTRLLSLVEVETLQGHRNAKIDPEFAETHGNRIARLRSHRRVLERYFTRVKPHKVISEAPFMGQHAAAYAALVECIAYIRFALEYYDDTVPLVLIDPPTVKNGVGAPGNADKDRMRQAVLEASKHPPFINPSRIDLTVLDEHSIDAIAVGLTGMLPLLKMS